jgi:NADPH:quinone reductase-like Zn-dependent oxidoreductase
LPVAYGTALRMMYTIGKIKAGDKVLILARRAGWAYAAQLAKNAGCEVIACASSPEKLERLRALGADVLIDYTKQDYVKLVYEKYGKPHRRRFTGGVDVVVNYTGGDTWVPSLKVLHRQGKALPGAPLRGSIPARIGASSGLSSCRCWLQRLAARGAGRSWWSWSGKARSSR